MRKLLTSKWFIIVVVVLVLIATVLLGLLPGSPVRKITKPVSGVVSPIQAFVKKSGDTIEDFFAAIGDGIAIREENEALKAEIAELQYQLTQNEEAAIRYEELKNAFHIKDAFSNYDIYGAQVLSRASDEWFSVIRLGIDKSSGINLEHGESLAVVDVEMNLLGRVIEVSDTETTILPLLHEGFTVNCKINEINGANLIVSGDAGLKEDGLCLVSGIDSNIIIEPGTEIVTSGEGGFFPAGIPVGVIESVDYSNSLNVTATLRPYSDIGNLSDVFIMVPFEEDAGTEAEGTDVTSPEG